MEWFMNKVKTLSEKTKVKAFKVELLQENLKDYMRKR